MFVLRGLEIYVCVYDEYVCREREIERELDICISLCISLYREREIYQYL